MRQKNTFHKRLDQDTENRLMEQGKFRAAKNARISSSNSDNVGTAESMPSNTIFTALYSWPTGTNKCIGTCADVKNNAIVYCFYNSNGNHRIIQWDADTNVLTDILPTAWDVTALGWTSASKLWNMRIVESGTSQIMFFHEVQGVPMRINLGIRNERGATYTLTSDDITVARKPPIFNPTFTYAVDPAAPSSFIQNRFFQFRYRYIYEDKEQSTWSPWSDISYMPQDGVAYNKIIVTFNSGVKGVTKVEIARREGNGSTSTGTTNPELYIFNTWIKGVNSDNTNYTVNFFNSEVLTPVSTISANKLFDQVPQVVGCQEVIQSNQVIYGDITEGYGNLPSTNVVINQTLDLTGARKYLTVDDAGFHKITIDASFVPEIDDFIYVQVDTLVFSRLVTPGNSPDEIGSLIASMINQLNPAYTATNTLGVVTTNIPWTTALWVYSIPEEYVNYISVDYNKTATQTIGGGYTKIDYDQININVFDKISLSEFKVYPQSNPINYSFNINYSITGAGAVNIILLDVEANTPIFQRYVDTLFSPIGVIAYQIESACLVGRTLAIVYEKISGGTLTAAATGNTLLVESTEKYQPIKAGFKSGATHRFGLVYYDQYMRQSGVQGVTGTYIKSPSQRSGNRQYYVTDSTQEGYIPQLNWEIKHLPPDWAYYYSWAYDGGSPQKYAQFIATVDLTNGVVGNTIKVDISNLSAYPFTYNSFSVGDSIRIIGYPLESKTFLVDIDTVYITGVISGISSTNMYIVIDKQNLLEFSLNNVLIEAYAINKSELFYEQTVYEIGNPTTANRYHKGPNQNQNPANPTGIPAKGDFIGATYFSLMTQYYNIEQSAQVVIYIETSSISTLAESDFWNKGRAMIETPDQTRERNRYMYRWGNQLLQNTQVNGMSTFDSGNYGVLSAKFGTLTAMREIGYTLKMLQESNYSTAFIGRKELQNADGSTNLVVTDYLIGTINPSEDLYGTKYPGSVLVNGRNLYWLDTIKGKYIRESGNQPFPISDYNMVNYWRQASKTIDSLGYVVFTGFDKQTEQLFVTYKRELYETATTISFYDPERDGIEKGWVAEHDFNKVINSAITQIDMYGWVGQTFTSALANGIYKHNSTSSYLNLYGEQKTFSITSVFNANFDEIKVFLAHWVKANKAWDLTLFTTPASAMNPNGMRTYLVPGNYALKEAAYYADLKNDGYTKGFVVDDSVAFKQQMVTGRPLREQAILVTLSYADSSIFVLFDHEIGFIQSPWT